jgi:hypothetical protein
VAVDLLVYAPVGLAVSAKELVPELIERGRAQVGAARIIGQFAVEQGQHQVAKAFSRAREQAQERIENLTAPKVVPARRTAPAPAPKPTPRPVTSSPAGAALAIPGYDSLSASQVLPRLEGLSESELEAVRAYEADHRGRKTILGRIAQLQGTS